MACLYGILIGQTLQRHSSGRDFRCGKIVPMPKQHTLEDMKWTWMQVWGTRCRKMVSFSLWPLYF